MVATKLSLLTGLLAAGSLLAEASPVDKRAGCTITSLADVAAAKANCNAITINKFQVPKATMFDMTGLKANTVVTLAGDVTFTGGEFKDGILFSIDGDNITFDGKGHTFDGQGKVVWDGKGSNGGTDKPKFFRATMSGTIKDLKIINSPRQVFSIGNKSKLVIDGVTIDNRAGDALGSDGKPLGHNSDCFDVSATGTTIQNSFCYNQDDCLAINKGSNIQFLNNFCSGGHGISIGSIQEGSVVDTVLIKGNKVESSTNGLRIKTQVNAKSGSVSNITYDGNTITNASDYGIVIQQDYDNGSPTGVPTNGITISNVAFTGGLTNVSAGSKAQAVKILCGSDSCKGPWNWSSLRTTAGGVQSTKVPTGLTLTGYSGNFKAN